MDEHTELLPVSTTDGGYWDIKKNILVKNKDVQSHWARIRKTIRGIQKDYRAIQGLRHRAAKYRKKHKSLTRENTKAKEKRQEMAILKYIDDEAIEDEGSDSEEVTEELDLR